MPCLLEIKKVLERHNALGRFGVALLHKHFDLGEGEVLVETTDHHQRVQEISPRLANELDDTEVMPTIVALGGEGATLGCYVVCVKRHDGSGHYSSHIQQGA